MRSDRGGYHDHITPWTVTADNDGPHSQIAGELAMAEVASRITGQAARRFKEFWRTAYGSWSHRRRVITKAESTHGGPSPRFVVTSLRAVESDGGRLYEDVYCARGEMENRIKECRLDLRRSNLGSDDAGQLAPSLADLDGPCPVPCGASASGTPIRRHLRHHPAPLLKIGALVRTSCRRIKVAMVSTSPCKTEYALAHLRLTTAR